MYIITMNNGRTFAVDRAAPQVVTNPTLNRPTTREGFRQYFEPFFVEPTFPANWTAVDIARFL